MRRCPRKNLLAAPWHTDDEEFHAFVPAAPIPPQRTLPTQHTVSFPVDGRHLLDPSRQLLVCQLSSYNKGAPSKQGRCSPGPTPSKAGHRRNNWRERNSQRHLWAGSYPRLEGRRISQGAVIEGLAACKPLRAHNAERTPLNEKGITALLAPRSELHTCSSEAWVRSE